MVLFLYKNFQVLPAEMFKTNKGISSSIMKGIFELRAEYPYSLRCIFQFSAPLVRTLFHDTESKSYLGPKIWSLLPEDFKNINFSEHFKILIKKSKPENCSFRLCKAYIKKMWDLCRIRNVEYENIIHIRILCRIRNSVSFPAQDIILITKFNIFRFRFFTFLFHQKFNFSTAL